MRARLSFAVAFVTIGLASFLLGVRFANSADCEDGCAPSVCWYAGLGECRQVKAEKHCHPDVHQVLVAFPPEWTCDRDPLKQKTMLYDCESCPKVCDPTIAGALYQSPKPQGSLVAASCLLPPLAAPSQENSWNFLVLTANGLASRRKGGGA